LANYIDPDTLDRINATHKPPLFQKGKNKTAASTNTDTEQMRK
jgi:hypothetical protein